MKKFLALLGFLLIATFGFAQVPPVIPTIPAPYILTTQEYGAANGHEVLYCVAYGNSGVTYLVLDPGTSVADQNDIFRLVQYQANTVFPNSRVIVLNTIPNQVNNGSNIYTVRTNAPFSVSNAGSGTTLTSIPGLQVNVDSTQNYYFRAVLYVSVGAGGSKIDFGGTAVPVVGSVVAQTTGMGANAVVYASQQTTFLSGPAGSATAVTQIIIEGYFQTNVGGTFVIQFAQSSANAANSTVLQGSSLTITAVP